MFTAVKLCIHSYMCTISYNFKPGCNVYNNLFRFFPEKAETLAFDILNELLEVSAILRQILRCIQFILLAIFYVATFWYNFTCLNSFKRDLVFPLYSTYLLCFKYDTLPEE